MPTTEELHELAVRAIDDFYRDRSVTMPEIRTGLVHLRDYLDELITNIPEGEEPDGPTDEEDTDAPLPE